MKKTISRFQAVSGIFYSRLLYVTVWCLIFSLNGCTLLKKVKLPEKISSPSRSSAPESSSTSRKDTASNLTVSDAKVAPPVASSGVEKERVVQLSHPQAVIQAAIGMPEVENPQEIRVESFYLHRTHQGVVNALVVSPDGMTAYSGGEDGLLVKSTLSRPTKSAGKKSVKVAPGKLQMTTQTLYRGNRPIIALDLSRDGKYLAITEFSTVTIFDLAHGRVIAQMEQVKGRISDVAWDPQTKLVAFGLGDGNVYVWNIFEGRYAGQNSLNAVEQYPGGASPIVRILFHPTGRVFFVAERDGPVSVWRLLRTESEMGLRDKFAVADRETEGNLRNQFANIGDQITDMWLDPQGLLLSVAGVDGVIRRFKVRGLVAQNNILTGKEPILSLTGFPLKGKAGAPVHLVATTSREQRVKFWCETPKDESALLNEPIAKSELFTEALSLLRASDRASLLWGAEKTGKLLTFDSQELMKSTTSTKITTLCKSAL